MALLPFDTTKFDLLNNAKVFGVCEGYWELMRATDMQMLIDAGIPLVVYGYRSGILTDAILAQIDEALLNQNGIYTTDATILNPIVEIFVLGAAIVDITIDNGERHNVNVMGTASATVTISGNSFLKLKTYQNATATATVNDTSAICSDSYQNSTATITANNDAAGDVAATGDSILNLTFNDNSYSRVQGSGQSVITTAGAATQYKIELYDLSKIPAAPVI